jgi:hypothetical protein
MAAFNAMIHRLHTIPLTKENYNKEKNTILNIAKNNGYNRKHIITKIRQKSKQHTINKYLYHKTKEDNEIKPYKRILFTGTLTNNLLNLCKNKTFKPALYTNNTIKKYIFNNKPKVDKLDNSGIYKINCKNCNHTYIGQTGRKIHQRFEEHMKALKNFSINSEIADHMIQTGHHMDRDNIQLLHTCKKGPKMTILETLQINKHKDIVLNKIIPPINSPLLTLIPNSLKNPPLSLTQPP